jgi:hypothetical protein
MDHILGNASPSVSHAGAEDGDQPDGSAGGEMPKLPVRVLVGESVAERAAPVADRAVADSSAAPWRASDAAAAYALLALHIVDRQTGACPMCGTFGPCRPANAAAARLLDLGLPLRPEEPMAERDQGEPVSATVGVGDPATEESAADGVVARWRGLVSRNTWRGLLRPYRRDARPNIGPMPPIAPPPQRNAPLLTYGWRFRLGLVGPGRRPQAAGGVAPQPAGVRRGRLELPTPAKAAVAGVS